MAKALSIDEVIYNTDFNLAKLKFVQSKFPDVKLTVSKGLNNEDIFRFCSKTVNATYSNYKFEDTYKGLLIGVYNELLFNYNNREENIIINSSPKTCKLAFKKWLPYDELINGMVYKNHTYEICFSKFSFNMKKNNFKEDMLNDCRSAILQFIQKNHDCKINTKNLEPRLKKLLLFT